ncbi:hypothetical protein ACRALDRAFT_205869 [Sodiomyces alcalophilus JCM 7366]|uniref:uncharacterized protein n=1 Tax=Sodiomyces alcalophilus JCM 7366 TaxID=591952 RepID=UPI0039B505F7
MAEIEYFCLWKLKPSKDTRACPSTKTKVIHWELKALTAPPSPLSRKKSRRTFANWQLPLHWKKMPLKTIDFSQHWGFGPSPLSGPHAVQVQYLRRPDSRENPTNTSSQRSRTEGRPSTPSRLLQTLFCRLFSHLPSRHRPETSWVVDMQPLTLMRPASWRLVSRQLLRPLSDIPSAPSIRTVSTASLAPSNSPLLAGFQLSSRRLYSSSFQPPRVPDSDSKSDSPSPDPAPSSSDSSSSSPASNAESTQSQSAASSSQSPESDPDSSTSNNQRPSSTSSSFPFSSSASSWASSTASASKLFTTSIPRLIDSLQARLLTASHTLNDLTGYTAIESIKSQNAALEASLTEAHHRLRAARNAFKSATSTRAATQRETTTLLARKESWAPQDLERFTELYRRDHSLEREVAHASETLSEAEAEEQRLSQALVSGMLRRYHEEQIWSDRIRRASTWGTWGLMGLNVIMFVMLQFVAEPWRRKRLVRAVVEEEKEVLTSVREELVAVRGALAERSVGREAVSGGEGEATTAMAASEEEDGAAAVTAVAAADGDSDGEAATTLEPEPAAEPGETLTPLPPAVTWAELLSDPALLKDRIVDLYSDRRIDLRMRDASLLALQGAVAGATIVGGATFLLLRTAPSHPGYRNDPQSTLTAIPEITTLIYAICFLPTTSFTTFGMQFVKVPIEAAVEELTFIHLGHRRVPNIINRSRLIRSSRIANPVTLETPRG